MKKFTKIITMLLVVVMGTGVLSGCKKTPSDNDSSYTYRTYIGEMITTLNPLERDSDTERDIALWMSSGIVDMSLVDPASKTGEWEWTPDMASELPTDVTTQYAGQFGIPAATDEDYADNGYAFKVKLRHDLKWSNGDALKAADFVESLKLMIDPAYTHKQANQYMQGSTLDIAGLKEYVDYLKDNTKGDSDFSKVGFQATGEYELLFVFAGWNSEFMVYNNLPAFLVLVHKDTYIANRTEITTGFYKSTYNSKPEASMSYGPYKFTSMQEGAELVLTKNEHWYGWNDTRYAGQYQTTKIQIRVIPESATAMTEFKSGNLDGISLSALTYGEFADSSQLLTAPTSNTRRLSFCSDLEYLQEIETASQGMASNLKYLSNKAFRQAISYAINRDELAQDATAGSLPATMLINGWWEHDMDNLGEKFRDTRPAMEALAKYYGMTNYSGMTDAQLKAALANYASGFNLTKAKELFNQAVNELDGGTITGTIKIRLYASTLTETTSLLYGKINDLIKEAAKGTKLEGKIEFVATAAGSNMIWDMYDGKLECSYFAYAYPFIYPDSQLAIYVYDDQTIFEKGAKEFFQETNLTITIDGVAKVKTYEQWGLALVEGEYATAPVNVRVQIMAQLEIAILQEYYTVPLLSDTSYRLHSFKIDYSLESYHSLMEFGGLRYYKYNFNDTQWAERVSKGLDYTK